MLAGVDSDAHGIHELAMVDVEGFVLAGVPRSAFIMVPPRSSERWPTFRLDDDTLRSLGWTVELGMFCPPGGGEAEATHPYDLGPMWHGANSWLATFRLEHDGSLVEASVEPEWCMDVWPQCDPGSPLPSGSPWRWRILGLPVGVRCGRGENPVQAAAVAEEAVMAAGASTFPRTKTRRQLPS
jgi:hypothetical protein